MGVYLGKEDQGSGIGGEASIGHHSPCLSCTEKAQLQKEGSKNVQNSGFLNRYYLAILSKKPLVEKN